jgi:hypothetical protein
MTDDFLAGLRSSWRSQDAELTDLLVRLRRQRWRPHLALALELLATAVTMGVGVWFATIALEQRSLLFGMSAGILLFAAPALAAMAWVARRDSLRWEEETPESVLVSGMRRAEASLKVLRLGRVHLGLIAAFVVALWAMELGGWIGARGFLVIYTLICAAIAAIYLPWLAWRRKRVERECAECRRLLEDLRAGDGEVGH